MLRNGRVELTIDWRNGINPCRLVDLVTREAFADADYTWPEQIRPVLLTGPEVKHLADGGVKLTLSGRLPQVDVHLTYTALPSEPGVIREQVTLWNRGTEPVDLSTFACGLSKTLYDGNRWIGLPECEVITSIPNRRDGIEGALGEHRLVDVLMNWGSWNGGDRNLSAWQSDGWVWSGRRASLLITKYNQQQIEWSLLAPEWRSSDQGDRCVVRYGGTGMGMHQIGPEGLRQIPGGREITLGVTRLEVFTGGWHEGYLRHRRYMRQEGCRTHPDFAPRLHWHALYDIGVPVYDRSMFTADLVKSQAPIARDMGCDVLEIEPGWDTGFCNAVWAVDRMGPAAAFIREMRQQFGLDIALHTALGAWSVAEGYPESAKRMDAAGGRISDPLSLNALCNANEAYVARKVELLSDLARQGVIYFMIDGTGLPGLCHDPEHGHTIPGPTYQEHALAVYEIMRRLHALHPALQLESHDVVWNITKGAPTYHLYNRLGSFDSMWGNECMWRPYHDLQNGRALQLYYRRLAYDIPTYLCIDLHNENEHNTMFWYYASVVQHLGIGGTHPDPAMRERQKAAVQEYNRLRRLYTHGVFYGLHEDAHVHVLADSNAAVVNLFNFSDRPVSRSVRVKLSDIGLPSRRVRVRGVPFHKRVDVITLNVTLPPWGHALAELDAR